MTMSIVPTISRLLWLLLLLFRETQAWTSLWKPSEFPFVFGQITPPPPPCNVKILILPGFGNDQIDYFLPNAPQGSLVQSLYKRGWKEENVRVLPVARSDWFRVFYKGALDLKFWQNDAPATNPAFAWYLDLISQEINQMCASNDNDTKVVILGHSAGGWLARAALGYCTTNSNNNEQSVTVSSSSFSLDQVVGLVTLGTPHFPPPPQIMDMTRGALRLTHENFPDTYHSNSINNGLFYITVMGQAITGVPKDKNVANQNQQKQQPNWRLWQPRRRTLEEFAFDSYQIVCGQGDVIGDGVVPYCAGHLASAQKIDLPQVLHSINSPDSWYGSDAVLDSWHDDLLRAISKTMATATATTTSEKIKEAAAAATLPSWISQLLPQ